MNETVDYIIKFLYAAVLAGVPLMYGTLGEIITEKAGNLNRDQRLCGGLLYQ